MLLSEDPITVACGHVPPATCNRTVPCRPVPAPPTREAPFDHAKPQLERARQNLKPMSLSSSSQQQHPPAKPSPPVGVTEVPSPPPPQPVPPQPVPAVKTEPQPPAAVKTETAPPAVKTEAPPPPPVCCESGADVGLWSGADAPTTNFASGTAGFGCCSVGITAATAGYSGSRGRSC